MQDKLPSLNGLRALSIIFVLIGHIQEYNFNHLDAPGGQIGVNIFFVISGFLITFILIKEENETGTISLSTFYLRRVLRIFPVYYFILLIYFILEHIHLLQFSSLSWLTSLTYTKYFQYSVDMESGHFWSLSVEEHFYFIWPFVFKYIKKFRVGFALAVLIIIPFIRLFSDIPALHLFTRADSLMWGCLFAIYYQEILSFLERNKKLFYFSFVVLFLCLVSKRTITLLFSDLKILEKVVIAFSGSYGTITNICIGIIIIFSLNYKNNLWYKFLNYKVLNFIGIISYSIYIWQQLFFSQRLLPLSSFPYNILLILIVAIGSYHFVERPFLKLKKKFTTKNNHNLQTHLYHKAS